MSRGEFAAAANDPGGSVGRAALLLALDLDSSVNVAADLARLDSIAEIVAAGLPGDAAVGQIGRHLRATLGGDIGFGGSTADYADLRSSLLPEVLRRRRGLPILLSVVWLEIAARLQVPAHGIGLPGHFVVGIGDPEYAGQVGGPEPGFVLVDPFNGGVPFPGSAAYSLLGHAPTAHDLRPWDTPKTMLRILANIRGHAEAGHFTRIGAARTRLWAIEMSLLIHGCPVELHRAYGEALARSGDFVRAAIALEAYADLLAEDRPLVSLQVRQEARTARARLN
ncbi:MAG: transglutaminase family protein [Sporichthyaceae bacterium]